jgi:hypothetical protein
MFMENIRAQETNSLAIASQQEYERYALDSPLSGGANNPFTGLNENTTLGIAKINGFFLGRFLNRSYGRSGKAVGSAAFDHPFQVGAGPHDHMEDHFLEALNLLLYDASLASLRTQLLERSKNGRTLVITLKGMKSPCEKCAPNLIKFVTDVRADKSAEFDVCLRLKAYGIHDNGTQRAQIDNISSMMDAGIPLLPWVIYTRAGTKPVTKRGLKHELHQWNRDVADEDTKDTLISETKNASKLACWWNFDRAEPMLNFEYARLRALVARSIALYRAYSEKICLYL